MMFRMITENDDNKECLDQELMRTERHRMIKIRLQWENSFLTIMNFQKNIEMKTSSL